MFQMLSDYWRKSWDSAKDKCIHLSSHLKQRNQKPWRFISTSSASDLLCVISPGVHTSAVVSGLCGCVRALGEWVPHPVLSSLLCGLTLIDKINDVASGKLMLKIWAMCMRQIFQQVCHEYHLEEYSFEKFHVSFILIHHCHISYNGKLLCFQNCTNCHQ